MVSIENETVTLLSGLLESVPRRQKDVDEHDVELCWDLHLRTFCAGQYYAGKFTTIQAADLSLQHHKLRQLLLWTSTCWNLNNSILLL